MTLSSPEADRKQVIAVTDEEAAAMAAGDFARYEAILADDAVYLPPNSLPKEGNELRAWLKDFVERFAIQWLSFIHDETVVAGDFAYHRYTYSWRVTPKAGGEPVVGHGKGLQILRREPDGQWKMARSIWNAIPGPSSMP
jgi:ketosteroid isomerase-like protein